ncbi:MAG TPA: hypothetical protein H9668_07560, partial [Firmicutes bacterium]|nr:hypothetical protein [Bacillota bacterium]
MKKGIAILLAFLLTVLALPFSALPASAAEQGSCGYNLTWTQENGVLTITGTGNMHDFFNRLCHNKQLINSHFYRGVSELPYKLLFAVIYTHLEFRYEVSHTITSHHVHHFHQTRIPDGTLLDYMVQ